MLYKIIYQSIAKPDLTSEDIFNILKTARDFNQKHNITGCLIYYNHKFVQILEGEKSIVEDLYSNIKTDKRHSNVKTLVEIFERKRIFTNWNMGFVDLDSNDANNDKTESFKSNLITYIELIDKSDIASKVFWNKAKEILIKGKLF